MKFQDYNEFPSKIFYFVVTLNGGNPLVEEQDPTASFQEVCEAIRTGQFEHVQYVTSFDPKTGAHSDVTSDVMKQLADWSYANAKPLHRELHDEVERYGFEPFQDRSALSNWPFGDRQDQDRAA